jgi:CheY-like chemotaxis protein
VDSGEKAIEALRRASTGEPYQLLLMDWKMPGMDGIETATAIRKDPELHHPPIIMITAHERELALKRKDTTSVDALLMKPVKPSQLFNAIMELFGRAEAMVPRREPTPAAWQVHRLAGQRVLVVEDNELNRDVAVALLEETGLTVEVAENGGVAVQKVTDAPKGYYNAVFMDIQMPIMDGYEATRRIRAWESKVQDESTDNRQPTTDHRLPIAGHRIPIIALTAHALKGEKEKCLAADMDDYLAKPLDEHDLYRVMCRWIAS